MANRKGRGSIYDKIYLFSPSIFTSVHFDSGVLIFSTVVEKRGGSSDCGARDEIPQGFFGLHSAAGMRPRNPVAHLDSWAATDRSGLKVVDPPLDWH